MKKANMIVEIRKTEATLWRELCEHEYYNAPADGDDEKRISWEQNDLVHAKLISAWHAVVSLMDTLGIEKDLDDPENIAASEYSTKLFIRRQAARGIFYNTEIA